MTVTSTTCRKFLTSGVPKTSPGEFGPESRFLCGDDVHIGAALAEGLESPSVRVAWSAVPVLVFDVEVAMVTFKVSSI